MLAEGPGEREEIKREVDSKKPFGSVNELRREKHNDQASCESRMDYRSLECTRTHLPFEYCWWKAE